MTVEQFERLLKFKSDAAAKHTAPPSGLFLEKVLYKGDEPPSGIAAHF
jgi:tRNA U38,U39,U40 pseudouridine synthase TruA